MYLRYSFEFLSYFNNGLRIYVEEFAVCNMPINLDYKRLTCIKLTIEKVDRRDL